MKFNEGSPNDQEVWEAKLANILLSLESYIESIDPTGDEEKEIINGNPVLKEIFRSEGFRIWINLYFDKIEKSEDPDQELQNFIDKIKNLYKYIHHTDADLPDLPQDEGDGWLPKIKWK